MWQNWYQKQTCQKTPTNLCFYQYIQANGFYLLCCYQAVASSVPVHRVCVGVPWQPVCLTQLHDKWRCSSTVIMKLLLTIESLLTKVTSNKCFLVCVWSSGKLSYQESGVQHQTEIGCSYERQFFGANFNFFALWHISSQFFSSKLVTNG